MSTLHILSKSPFDGAALTSCSQICGQSDAVIFIEDGVYCAVESQQHQRLLQQMLDKQVSIYALSADIIARGIGDMLIKSIQVVNYDEFVTLTVNHQRIQSWY